MKSSMENMHTDYRVWKQELTDWKHQTIFRRFSNILTNFFYGKQGKAFQVCFRGDRIKPRLRNLKLVKNFLEKFYFFFKREGPLIDVFLKMVACKLKTLSDFTPEKNM